MDIIVETERLILREFLTTDVEDYFKMDSDPAVHTYLGNKPTKTIEEAEKIIQYVREQYADHGIGRWVAVEKSSGNFIGWSGLKFITEPENNRTDFYDVGFRFAKQFWGKGYATESGRASLAYAFDKLNCEEVIGTAHVDNIASKRALEKCGLKYIEPFDYFGLPFDWYSIGKEDYEGVKTSW